MPKMPNFVPVVLVEDQPRRGVGHGPGLGVDLAHDRAELVVGQGLVREALTLAVHHDAVRQRALAEEHAAERPALELLAGQLHAGHPPGVLHAGQVGADLLGQLDGDAVVTARARPARRRAPARWVVVSSVELSNPPLASRTPLVARTVCSTPSARTTTPRTPDSSVSEPDRGCLDAYVDAVAQACLEQRSDECRAGEPGLVDAHAAEQPERERVLGHAGGQGRSHELRGLAQPFGGVRAGEERPTDGRAVDVGAVVRPDRRDPAEGGVLLDVAGDVGAGLEELLDQVVVEDLVATLAVDVAPGLVQVVVDLQLLGREAVVGDPGGAGGDAGGAADELAGLHDEDARALLGGGERRHQAGTAGPDDRRRPPRPGCPARTPSRWSR